MSSSTNSLRVIGQSQGNFQDMAEVTALEFCFSTPRPISMQRWGRLHHHADAHWQERVLERLRDLGREPLLNLEPAD